jgi:hypothetical protein
MIKPYPKSSPSHMKRFDLRGAHPAGSTNRRPLGTSLHAPFVDPYSVYGASKRKAVFAVSSARALASLANGTYAICFGAGCVSGGGGGAVLRTLAMFICIIWAR